MIQGHVRRDAPFLQAHVGMQQIVNRRVLKRDMMDARMNQLARVIANLG